MKFKFFFCQKPLIKEEMTTMMITITDEKQKKKRLEQEMKLCVIFTKICLKLYFLIYKKVNETKR
jgi:hypothetical protein